MMTPAAASAMAGPGTAPRLVVLAAGGTGGHVFPAQALASELSERGHRLALVTDRRSRAYGGALGTLDTYIVPAASPSSPNPFRRMLATASIGLGILRALATLRRLSPALVVGFGGYPSVPTVLAAHLAHVRTMIHEQNAVIGRANRLLAPGAAAIATSFPFTRGLGSSENRAVHTGNPVRPEIADLANAAYQPPLPGTGMRLLVTGGIQGARTLGRTVPQGLALLPPSLRARLYVSQQCREEDVETARRTYADAGIAAEVATFYEDIPTRLAAAHLVISRAGASTVAELGVAGRPALLIPYPHATDDHQSENARQVSLAGGASILPESEISPEAVAARVEELLTAPGRLEDMTRAARAFARPDATGSLADLAERVIAGDAPGTATAGGSAA